MRAQQWVVSMAVAAVFIAAPLVAEEVPVTEISAPVTPFVFDGDLRDLPRPEQWKPGDPVKEIPRRIYPKPGTAVPPARKMPWKTG